MQKLNRNNHLYIFYKSFSMINISRMTSMKALGLIILCLPLTSLNSQVIISEIMISPWYDRSAGENYASNEYVELYNNSPEAIDLSGWHLGNRKEDDNDFLNVFTDSPESATEKPRLSPWSFALVVSKASKAGWKRLLSHLYQNTQHTHQNRPAQGPLLLQIPDSRFLRYGLSDEQGAIFLRNKHGDIVSSFSWKENPGRGSAWERLSPDENRWRKNLRGGTPGFPNQVWSGRSVQESPEDTIEKRVQILEDTCIRRMHACTQPMRFHIHIQSGESLHVSLHTLEGRCLRIFADGSSAFAEDRSISLSWKGRGAFGLETASGIYLLQVKIAGSSKTLQQTFPVMLLNH